VTAALAAALLSASPVRSEQEVGGFRMASDPKVVTVFGDAAAYRAYVDRFYELYAEMQAAREQFSREVQVVIATVQANAEGTGRRTCPADAIALSYSRAFHLGRKYHDLGKELEAKHISIHELDDLGETAGLTPDYRWKVARALKIYPQVLRDFRDMRVAFQQQLAGELAFAGCNPAQLVAKGDELEKAGASPLPLPAPVLPKPNKRDVAPSPVSATTVTFFVDNATCGGAVRVYIDGALLGEVGGGSKAAFRSPSGRHEMCLMSTTSQLRCGDLGTLRHAYIHDGWSIALRCD
jgi:hypothetical protein